MENKYFIKTILPEKFHNELQMSKRALVIASKSKKFSSPKLLEKDERTNTLVFERLENVITAREYFNTTIRKSRKCSTSSLGNLCNRIGNILCHIHNHHSDFENIEKYNLDEKYCKNLNKNKLVFIHGDFTLNNILYRSSDSSLFIVDWSTSDFFSTSSNYGPRFWDLNFFISSLSYHSISTLNKSQIRKSLIQQFIVGYLEEYPIDKSDFEVELWNYIEKHNYYNLYNSYWKIENLSLIRRFLIRFSSSFLTKLAQEQKQLPKCT